ncbi:TetR/AcrR family transcriptional regulator [Thauera sp.]|jgi:TetR/AcrR family transcriptional regulator|uniref:TetR/AcrR family transcriptional regulator n=1 Tax=Thauera sp. TaxID=1905334 RepID=UPI002610F92E|nr:TetR/AcrR family transcriptional regulator [Thauera sp.]MCK6408243.1 TetR/AcrR family transcriptional regulator [Thauera sp.]
MPDLADSARPARGRGRPRGQDANYRARLLDAALDAFGAQGFEAASLRTIAAGAGCDVSMVAHYFGSKAELWAAVVERIEAQVRAELGALDELEPAAAPIEARVVTAVGAMFEQAARHPQAIRFVMREMADGSDRADDLVRRVVEPVHAMFLPLWQEAIDAGIFSMRSPLALHTLLFGAISYAVASAPLLARLSKGEVDLACLRSEFMDGLFARLLRPATTTAWLAVPDDRAELRAAPAAVAGRGSALKRGLQ